MSDSEDISVFGKKEMASGSEVVLECPCRACLYEERYVEGVWFCVDCDEDLCDECYKYHKKALLSRGHLVKGKDGTSNETQLTTDNYSEMCKIHEGKVLEYYCFSHDNIACSACMTLDHKNCEETGFIPNIAKTESTKAEVKYELEKLQKLILQIENVKDSAEENSRCSQKYRQQVMEAVQGVRTRVVESLDDFEEVIRKELCRFAVEDSVKTSEVRASCDGMQQDITHIKDRYTELQNNAMHCRLFCEMKRNKDKISNLEEKLYKTRPSSIVEEVVLTLDEESDNIISHIKSMGTLVRRNPANAEIRHITNISAKTSSDQNMCKITGIVLLPGDRIVLADNNNSNIKLVDKCNGEIIAAFNLSSGPWSIAEVSETTVASTFPEEEKVLLIHVNKDTLLVDRQMDVNGECRGLSYNRNDTTFVISFVKPEEIRVVDMKGVVLRSFTTACKMYLISVLDDHMLASSAGVDEHSVSFLSMEGDIIATYTDGKLKGPLAVVELNGFMYACGWQSNNICAIDARTKAVTEILGKKRGISKPYSLLFDKTKNLLYVGMRDVDHIKVFEVV